MLTDAQLGTLIAAIVAIGAGLGAAIRWAARRLVKSQDAATDALIENAKSHAELAAKIDGMRQSIDRVVDLMLGIARPVKPVVPIVSTDSQRRRDHHPSQPTPTKLRVRKADDSGDYGDDT